jgi:hypothetical protein
VTTLPSGCQIGVSLFFHLNRIVNSLIFDASTRFLSCIPHIVNHSQPLTFYQQYTVRNCHPSHHRLPLSTRASITVRHRLSASNTASPQESWRPFFIHLLVKTRSVLLLPPQLDVPSTDLLVAEAVHALVKSQGGGDSQDLSR